MLKLLIIPALLFAHKQWEKPWEQKSWLLVTLVPKRCHAAMSAGFQRKPERTPKNRILCEVVSVFMEVSAGGYFFFFNQKSWFLNESTDLLVESIISYTFYKTYYPESTLILSKQQIDPPFARTWWNRNSVTRKSQHENYILAGGEKNSSHALIRLVWKPLPDLKHGADCKHLGKSYYMRKRILWTPAHQFTLLSVCSLWPTLTI